MLTIVFFSEMLLRSIVPIWFLFILLLSFWSSICMLDINPLLDWKVEDILLLLQMIVKFCWWFSLLWSSFALDKILLYIFVFLFCFWCLVQKYPWLFLCPETFLLFSLSIFTVVSYISVFYWFWYYYDVKVHFQMCNTSSVFTFLLVWFWLHCIFGISTEFYFLVL